MDERNICRKSNTQFEKIMEEEVPDTYPPIDRNYALHQVDLAIKDAQSDDERKQFERIKAFLTVLPSPADLKEQVRCTDCACMLNDNDGLECLNAGMCDFSNPEAPKPKHERCYFEKKDIKV